MEFILMQSRRELITGSIFCLLVDVPITGGGWG